MGRIHTSSLFSAPFNESGDSVRAFFDLSELDASQDALRLPAARSVYFKKD